MSNPIRSRKTKGVQPRLLHAVVGRPARKKTVNEKRWWLVDYLWNSTPSSARETSISDALQSAKDRAKWEQVTNIVVTEVEVIERRKVIEQLKTKSSNAKLSDSASTTQDSNRSQKI